MKTDPSDRERVWIVLRLRLIMVEGFKREVLRSPSLIHFHLDLVGANLAKESRVTLIQNPELNNFSRRDAAIRISELKAIFLLTCLRLSSNLPRTFFFQEEKLRVRFFG